jgi:hypothetical protein
MKSHLVFSLLNLMLVTQLTSCSIQTGQLASNPDRQKFDGNYAISVKNNNINTQLPNAHHTKITNVKLNAESFNQQTGRNKTSYRDYHEKRDVKSTLFKKLTEQERRNSMALLSFLLALSIIPPFTFLIVPGLAALTTGAIALRQMKRVPAKYTNKWMAKVGVIFGSLYSIALVAFILFASSFGVSTLLVIPIIANFIVSMLVLSGN